MCRQNSLVKLGALLTEHQNKVTPYKKSKPGVIIPNGPGDIYVCLSFVGQARERLTAQQSRVSHDWFDCCVERENPIRFDGVVMQLKTGCKKASVINRFYAGRSRVFFVNSTGK